MKYKNICGKKNAYILNNDICEKFLNFYIKLVDCLEKCLIYRHIRRVAD